VGKGTFNWTFIALDLPHGSSLCFWRTVWQSEAEIQYHHTTGANCVAETAMGVPVYAQENLKSPYVSSVYGWVGIIIIQNLYGEKGAQFFGFSCRWVWRWLSSGMLNHGNSKRLWNSVSFYQTMHLSILEDSYLQRVISDKCQNMCLLVPSVHTHTLMIRCNTKFYKA
jgi:hypothetical protein